MNSQLLPAEAARLLLQRRAIRQSLTEWATYKGYPPAPHHALIIRELEAFVFGDEFDVLLLHAPPGSAKSTFLSVLFPAWYLANFPANNILAATHSVEFAQRWGRRVRNDIAAEGQILGIQMSGDNAAADRWALKSGGEYYGVGAGVGISGFRADLAVADDLFGNREDAYSETIRAKRWDWYVDDFSARLKPKAKRVLMNTRWHEEDVAGRVIQQIERGIVRGKIITIPAIAEGNDLLGRKPGEYLWDEPSAYNYGAYLRERQKETSAMMWAALYQQRPAPDDGDYFKAEWFKPVHKLPDAKTLRVYGGSDYAVTADGGDYTVHVVVGVDPEERIYILDLWRQQASSEAWVEAFCDLVLDHKPMGWAEEHGQITASLGPFINQRQRKRNAWCAREQFPTRGGDKAVRAQSIRGRAALAGIYYEADAQWWPDLRSELLSFPAGKHDDQVDALGLVGQLLDRMLSGDKLPEPSPSKKADDYRSAHDTVSPGDWQSY